MKCYLKTSLSLNDKFPVLTEHPSVGVAVMTMIRHVRILLTKGYDLNTIRCVVHLEDDNQTVAAEFSHGLYYPRGIGDGYRLFLRVAA